jgi:hypothetical protein
LASAVIISRSSVLLLSTTKANFGPLAPKSKVPRVDGVPGPPAVHVPTAVTRVWGVPLKSPSASRVGAPKPLNERNPTYTAGAPGVVGSFNGRTSAASKAQVKVVGQAVTGIEDAARAFPQPSMPLIKPRIVENRFMLTFPLQFPTASDSCAGVRTGIDKSESVAGVKCDKTQQGTVRSEIERAGRSAGAAGAGTRLDLDRLQYSVFVLENEDGRYWCGAAVEDHVSDDDARLSRIGGIAQRFCLRSTQCALEARDRASGRWTGRECAAAEGYNRADRRDDE